MKHYSYAPSEVLEIAKAVLSPGVLYYHEIEEGAIYRRVNGEKWGQKVIDLFLLTGEKCIPFSHEHFNITSGLKEENLEKILKRDGLK